MTTAAGPIIEETYDAYGAVGELFDIGPDQREVILSGPAGTGKSRGILEYLNWACAEWPTIRCLMLRKTRRSLTESGMVTLERKVLHPAQGVHFHTTTQQYRYPNGSIIAVGGMDKPGKIMSSEWDIVYVQEATELTEHEWEAATTRLRNGKLPWQQMLGNGRCRVGR
jgi:phage terminase large subunit